MFAAPRLSRGALVIPFEASAPLRGPGGSDFVCRPDEAVPPKAKAFRNWIVDVAQSDGANM